MSEHFKTYCVVNPNSANGSTFKAWPEIHKRIEAAIGEVGFGLTESQGHATVLAAEALRQGYEQIVAVGGDGTNNEVVNGFFDEHGAPLAPEAVFAFVTRGTGGDFRRIFGFDRELDTFVANLCGREASRVDVGRLSFVSHQDRPAVRYFINITSFGIGGLVDEKVNHTSKVLGGKASFMIATVRALLEYRNQLVRLRIDDGEVRTLRVNNVAIANGQYFGGGMWVAPMARIDDGWFEVVVFGDLTTWQVIRGSSRIYEGTHLQDPDTEHFRCRKLVAESDERVLLDVDGEQPGRLPATFQILPAAIRVKGKQTSKPD